MNQLLAKSSNDMSSKLNKFCFALNLSFHLFNSTASNILVIIKVIICPPLVCECILCQHLLWIRIWISYPKIGKRKLEFWGETFIYNKCNKHDTTVLILYIKGAKSYTSTILKNLHYRHSPLISKLLERLFSRHSIQNCDLNTILFNDLLENYVHPTVATMWGGPFSSLHEGINAFGVNSRFSNVGPMRAVSWTEPRTLVAPDAKIALRFHCRARSSAVLHQNLHFTRLSETTSRNAIISPTKRSYQKTNKK